MCIWACVCVLVREVGRVDMLTSNCCILISAVIDGCTKYSRNTGKINIGGIICTDS